ncbi:CDP-glucose 4,6-dehydratase [Solimonas flava]|uniref:CDP-glucose 4,6-dehydratase n=1 Tax=Solimonas flava TaxID=415849 RepID=UPI0004878204|nr:CDP-glucose 4,6-dehydratase [Solimonas flava]
MEALVDADFWRGKRVFVTGHTGFKGSWLSLWLHKLGASVVGYSLPPPTNPSLFEAAGVERLVDTTFGDIRERETLVAVMRKAEPDIVFHMAAQPLVRLSYQDPVGTYATNVMGTVHVLEALRASPSVRAAVIISSDKCYENKEWDWGYRENEPMGGYDPYSNSKGCTELVVSAYRSSFFNAEKFDKHRLALASARAGNVIGGGDWAGDRLVPDFIRAIVAGEELRIRSPHAIRPWQHVLEPLSGYLVLAQKLFADGSRYAQGWNFGPNDQDAKPVEWLVERLVQLWGDGARWRLDDQVHPHEANYLKLDISKVRGKLGWEPRWSLSDALANVVEWYRAHVAGADMRQISLQQISAYEAR